jgi:hypothetical protein
MGMSPGVHSCLSSSWIEDWTLIEGFYHGFTKMAHSHLDVLLEEHFSNSMWGMPRTSLKRWLQTKDGMRSTSSQKWYAHRS